MKSNTYEAPFEHNGGIYKTVEHFFQAFKTPYEEGDNSKCSR